MERTVINEYIGHRLRTLVILACIVVASVLAFQVSWLLNSYRASRQQAAATLNTILEDALSNYKQVKADSARTLMNRLIRSEDIKDTIFRWPGNAQVAYKAQKQGAYVMYPIREEDIPFAESNPYGFLKGTIDTLPVEDLRPLAHALFGTNFYPAGSGGSFLYSRLLFQLGGTFADSPLLDSIINELCLKNSITFPVRIQHVKDIDQFAAGKPGETKVRGRTPVPGKETKAGPAAEVRIRARPLTEKLDKLRRQVAELNQSGNRLFVVKPLLYDTRSLHSNRVPLIVLSAKVPATYLLKNMVFSIIGTLLLLLFLSFCIGYMLYLIARQKKLSEVKNDFISNMSHELKTPIATTLAAVQGMQHFGILEDKEKTARYLNTASAELQRLSALITKILNSTVFESSEFSINPSVFDLREMIEEVINAQHLLGKGQVHIALELAVPLKLFADRTHLQQALNNLLDNAVKYALKPPQVTINCNTVKNGIEIVISDNGPGIAREYQKNIFDRFFRVPAPDNYRVKGYGLGLNYVKAIAAKHGGHVALTKSDASGSTFTLFIPQ